MDLAFFGQGSRPLIGVDVSSSAVKMLELGESGRGVRRVERYAIVPLPKESVVDGTIVKADLVEAAMRDAWRRLETKTRDVAMALPASSVITKRILLQGSASEAEIEAQVAADANQMASFPLDEVSLDYQILDPNAKNPSENDAILVVTRKERVEERVAVAEGVGLVPRIMDVDAYAALTAYEQVAFQLPDGGQGQTVAVVDIGAQTTHVNVLSDNQPVYQREHALGGNMLTNEITRRFDMSPEEAEDAKRKGLLPERYESEVLQPFLDSIALEIGRALQMFFAATSFQKVDHILLVGGCAAIPGLDDIVHSKTQTSTIIANPFAKMAVSGNVRARQLAADAPALFVACGLALRRFDPV